MDCLPHFCRLELCRHTQPNRAPLRFSEKPQQVAKVVNGTIAFHQRTLGCLCVNQKQTSRSSDSWPYCFQSCSSSKKFHHGNLRHAWCPVFQTSFSSFPFRGRMKATHPSLGTGACRSKSRRGSGAAPSVNRTILAGSAVKVLKSNRGCGMVDKMLFHRGRPSLHGA